MYADPAFEAIKRKLGHQSERWQLIEDQREPQFRVRKVETDPVKIHDAMSEEANLPLG